MRALLLSSLLWTVLLTVVLHTACSHAVDAPPGPVAIADDQQQAVAFAVPSDVDSERVYLGDTNWVSTSVDWPWHYGVFDLNPRARVLLELYEPAAWSDVGFKVYRVTADGALVLLGAVDGAGGYAAALLSTRAGGSYVVESVGATAPLTLALELTCARSDGECSPLQQPQESCGGRRVDATCDQGLFCLIDQGCGFDDRGGACARPVQMCPAVFGPEVCGCDGKNYSTGCVAHAAGVNVNFEGQCPCDPSLWSRNVDAFVDPTGTWTFHGPYGGDDVSATLVLRDDGSFNYAQVWDPQCLHSEPSCRRASRVFDMHGSWQNQGFAVQLLPVAEDGATIPEELAQSFGIETTCDGGVRLTTTELNEERIFERDRCADLSCEAGEHCELHDVVCVRAPCPPLPTCVADQP